MQIGLQIIYSRAAVAIQSAFYDNVELITQDGTTKQAPEDTTDTRKAHWPVITWQMPLDRAKNGLF